MYIYIYTLSLLITMIEKEKVSLQDLYVVISSIKRDICVYVYIIRPTVFFPKYFRQSKHESH